MIGLSLIIPYRNEAAKISYLLSAITKQIEFPEEIIFVNDHSEDESEKLIRQWSDQSNIQIQLICLAVNEFGKKEAIHQGVKNASSNYCLTIDSDVVFSPYFIKEWKRRLDCDMRIGKVIMTYSNFFTYFFAIDYMLFNAYNYFFSSLYINSASGANLLFARNQYLKWYDLVECKEKLSGDDYYLLRTFQQNNLKIKMEMDDQTIVYTESSKTFKEFISQRKRWLKKIKLKWNSSEFIFALLLLNYQLSPIYAGLFSLFSADLTLFFGVCLTKYLLDFGFLLNYHRKFNFVYFSLFFPIGIICIPLMMSLILIVKSKPDWKGREI